MAIDQLLHLSTIWRWIAMQPSLMEFNPRCRHQCEILIHPIRCEPQFQRRLVLRHQLKRANNYSHRNHTTLIRMGTMQHLRQIRKQLHQKKA